MQSSHHPTSSSVESNSTEIETFSQWSNRRFEIYQQVEEQSQEQVAHILQLARELTMKMEEEAAQLLTRYQNERSAVQAQIDEARQHVQQLQQEKDQLERECQQAKEAIEEHRKTARKEREHIIQEAYAERDRILTEAHKFVQRLVGQRFSYSPEKLSATIKKAAEEGGGAEYADMHASHSTRLTAHEAEAFDEVEDEYTEEAAAADDEGSAKPSAARRQVATSEATADDGVLHLIIEGVESFILASELIDRFEEHSLTEGVNLSQYEQKTLQLSIQQLHEGTIEQLIREEFRDTLEILDVDGNMVWLRYRSE